jgi:hypothetical protein
LLKKHEETLDKIIDLDGDCLDAKICEVCPFASLCLPDFLHTSKRPTKQERVQMALDTLTRNHLMADDDFPENP